MKKQDKMETKYFKIQFSKLVYGLIISVLLLSFASIGVSVWQIVQFGLHDFSDYLKYPVLILISVFCIVVVVSMLVKSEYGVNKQYLTTSYGIIKSKFPIQKITSMLLDTDTKKLTMHFGEEFIVLNIKQEWNEGFVRAVLDANPNVEYSFTMAENKPQNDEK